MTNEKSYVNMMATNPVRTVAPAASRRRQSVTDSDRVCQISTRQPGLPMNAPAQIADYPRRMKGPARPSPLRIKKV